MTPQFSIVIPTRERHKTLPYAIQSVLDQTFGGYEIVVQDNCSSDATYKAVKAFADKRVVYSRSEKRLPMHDNWEAGLEETSGQYVTFLGDDDALLPHCLERCNRLLAASNGDLLAWPAHTYYWPDVPDVARANHLTLDVRNPVQWGMFAGLKMLRLRATGLPRTLTIDSSMTLRNWLSFSGFRPYVPTYHNMVSRSVIDRVRQATGGRYFFNPLPDICTLIANLYVTDEVLYHCDALSMTGHSGSSAGGTHGSQRAWDAHLANFIAESGWTVRELMPSLFTPLLWGEVLIAGCFEDVKRRLFPFDGPEIDWPGFVAHAASRVNSEPEEARGPCKEWLWECAEQLGLAMPTFPPVQPWTRKVGTILDPLGMAANECFDGDALGFKTISDAVAFAGARHEARERAA